MAGGRPRLTVYRRSIQEHLSVTMKKLTALILLLFVCGCSHPLEIEGEGDIVSSSGTRNCSAEEQPCENLIVGEYDESYRAVPRPGHRFVRWENCGDQFPECTLLISEDVVRDFWGETAAPLIAVFEPIGEGPNGGVNTMITSQAMAVNFLSTASFGASKAEAAALVGGTAAAWMKQEFEKPPTLFLDDVEATRTNDGELPRSIDSALYWDKIIDADDQLRQRMVFALSQVLVVSDRIVSQRKFQNLFAYYREILSHGAFGNYRDLLKDVTYAPAMAEWLTYIKNQKGDPTTGRMPDENYAREFLQLYTIGLVELNLDGTPKLDGAGEEIELYTNDDIIGLARVFTGLSYDNERFRRGPSNVPIEALHSPLKIFPEEHSPLAKSFLGLTIPAGTGAADSIDMAIDHVFEHPNVGPFLARQLIQRFTASSPTPDYVERVAGAFNAGMFTSLEGTEFGTGVRGDLTATLAAILLDPEFFDANRTLDQAEGKLREPILRLVHWVRAFDAAPVDALVQSRLRDTSGSDDGLAQHPFRSPSVFNFYRPGYIAPGTQTGERNITAPELQLVNATSQFGIFNTLSAFAFGDTRRASEPYDTFVPNYNQELPLAYDEVALIDHLDFILTGNQLSNAEKDEFIAVLTVMDKRTDTPEREAEDRFNRVALAVSMVLSSPSYVLVRRIADAGQ